MDYEGLYSYDPLLCRYLPLITHCLHHIKLYVDLTVQCTYYYLSANAPGQITAHLSCGNWLCHDSKTVGLLRISPDNVSCLGEVEVVFDLVLLFKLV